MYVEKIMENTQEWLLTCFVLFFIAIVSYPYMNLLD